MAEQADQSGPEAGERDWANVLAQHDRWLRAVVRAREPDAHAAEEILQEVALAAVRDGAAVAAAGPSRLAAWLYRVAVRQTLLHRRRAGRRRRRLAEAARRRSERPPAAPPDPLAWLLDRERDQLVRAALEQLPPLDRQVLLLKYGEGWSYQQMAERLGVSRSAIESRLHRARQRLRRILAGPEHEQEAKRATASTSGEQ